MIISPTINGIKYNIKNVYDTIENTLVNGCQWNEEIVNIIKQYIKERNLSHFLNVGSHIGSVSLPISLCIKQVTAIEAYPPTYRYLRENIQLNSLTNITTHNVAVGNSEESIYFISEETDRIANNTGGMHAFTNEDILQNIRSSSLTDKKIQGSMKKMDNLDIDNFDIMLVDIEGCEYEFLLGAREKILKNKPIIIIEIWNDSKRLSENMKLKQNDIIQYILSLNYRLIKNIGEDFIFEAMDISNHCKIPKRIFQTFKTKQISTQYQPILDTWKLQNPNYEYTLFDDADCEAFLKEYFDPRVLNAYRRILPGGFKADLWRYCVLYIHGGVYVDIDTVCLGKLDDFLTSDVEFMTPIDLCSTYKLFNTFIASVPRSPILQNCIERVLQNVETNTVPESRLDFSGPGVLGKAVNSYLQLEETSHFRGKEGLNGSIYLLKFEPTTEYIKDINDKILLQNKNGNSTLRVLYNLESRSVNTVCWVNSPQVLL